MTSRLKIFVADHRDRDLQVRGPAIEPWTVDEDPKWNGYCDYQLLYDVWYNLSEAMAMPTYVGFFTHRKYLLVPGSGVMVKPGHSQNWYETTKRGFDHYREFWQTYDGGDLFPLLATHDVVSMSPFPLSEDIYDDFRHSRSEEDGELLQAVMTWPKNYGHPRQVYSWLMVTRWEVFHRMMREIEPLRQKLAGCKGNDSTNAAYRKRPGAYLMERVYSLWLENAGLSIKEVPLLQCWEM